MPSIGERIDALDTGLFDSIETQSSAGDRRAWLAIQRAVRRPSGYNYLEIGSHLGGSIQQHLPDPLCRGIVSIDKRPAYQPDDRGTVFHYEGNSTARMLENLRRVAPDCLDKLHCYDADTRDIDPGKLPARPDFCFIDGEHSHRAVLSDFAFCLQASSPDAAICFHDDWIISRAIGTIMSDLKRQGVPFVARKLSGVTLGIFLGNCPAARDQYILQHSRDGSRWLRRQRIIKWIPAWVRPTAGWVARKLRLVRPDA
jgi:hypothetical protein